MGNDDASLSTPTIVMPSGVAGLEFTDEAAALNKAVAELKEKKVEAISHQRY